MYHAIPIGVQDAGGKGQNSSCFNVAIVSMHIYIYIYMCTTFTPQNKGKSYITYCTDSKC